MEDGYVYAICASGTVIAFDTAKTPKKQKCSLYRWSLIIIQVVLYLDAISV